MTTKKNHENIMCQICKTEKKASEMIPGGIIRRSITETIKAEYPDWSPNGYICLADLNRFRSEYVEDVIRQDKGELTALEEQVVKSLKEHELLTKNLNVEYDQQISLGDRLADKLADFGGSWRFIGIFTGVLLLWILANTILLLENAFDPYPYILLNLVLSCLAAIQAPVIMMSQNRQEAKDRPLLTNYCLISIR